MGTEVHRRWNAYRLVTAIFRICRAPIHFQFLINNIKLVILSAEIRSLLSGFSESKDLCVKQSAGTRGPSTPQTFRMTGTLEF
jgi:hypothetical protein